MIGALLLFLSVGCFPGFVVVLATLPGSHRTRRDRALLQAFTGTPVATIAGGGKLVHVHARIRRVDPFVVEDATGAAAIAARPFWVLRAGRAIATTSASSFFKAGDAVHLLGSLERIGVEGTYRDAPGAERHIAAAPRVGLLLAAGDADLDRWLRSAKRSHAFYMGGVIFGILLMVTIPIVLWYISTTVTIN